MLYSVLCLIPSIIVYTLGEYYSKVWANKPTILGCVPVLICYGISGLLWLPALYYKNHLLILGFIWALLAAVATVLVSICFFGEPATPRQCLGLVLALVAVILLT
jgi:multidrug transporter EmrE-like cation transporter